MHARCQLLAGRVSAQGVAIRTAQSSQRTYATSAPTPAVKNPLQRRRGGDLGSHLPKHVIPKDAYIPAYPYGEHKLFKQANRGLYGEQMKRFGNNVSDETETKTRRYWKPNVLSKSLYSVALKKRIKLRVTAKVLKTMDREGGLDEYLLKDNVARIKELGPMGWALRWTLMQKPEVIGRLRADAAALGIDQAIIDQQWPTPHMMAEQKAAQAPMIQEDQINGLEDGEFVETEEQEMWSPEDGEAEEEESVLENTALDANIQKKENSVVAQASSEYTKAVKAAQRYLHRGVVDSEEEGIKLAFIRVQERHEASSRIKKEFLERARADFTSEDLDAIRNKLNLPKMKDEVALKIAYRQRKRRQIDEAGGIEAWNALRENAEKATAWVEKVKELGGEGAILARKKAEYAALINEAASASTNASLPASRRSFLVDAIRKAGRAISARAGAGIHDYVKASLAELRRKTGLKTINEQSKHGKGDAWSAIVQSSNRPLEDSPRA